MTKKLRENLRSTCPVCLTTSLRVIESKPGQNGTVRRRKACEQCGHRFTTREITDNTYFQLLESQRILAKVRGWLGGSPVMRTAHNCEQCVHWSKDECNMGFPEAGGPFAEECSTFVLQ